MRKNCPRRSRRIETKELSPEDVRKLLIKKLVFLAVRMASYDCRRAIKRKVMEELEAKEEAFKIGEGKIEIRIKAKMPTRRHQRPVIRELRYFSLGKR